MNALRAAAQQALEALEDATSYTGCEAWSPSMTDECLRVWAVLKAALAEPVQEPVAWGVFGANLHDMFFTEEEAHEMAMLKGDGSTVAPLYTSPPQRPAEPVQCDPQYAVTEDGYCEWVCPVPNGYLMQCCDCGLIHEVDFRVARYEPQPSEDFVVIDDPNMQAQLRMRRRDDLFPKKSQEPVAWISKADINHPSGWRTVFLHTSAMPTKDSVPLYAAPQQRPAEPVEPVGYLWPTGRHPEFRFTQQKRDGVLGTPVYLSPPQRKPLTDDQLDDIAVAACKGNLHDLRIAIEQAHGIKEKT